MTTISCPSIERLQHLLAGAVQGAEAERLEAHIADCQRCTQALGSLSTSDDLQAVVREAATHRPLRDPLSDQLTAAFREVPVWIAHAPHSASDPGSAGSTADARTDQTLGGLPKGDIISRASISTWLQPAASDAVWGTLGKYQILGAIGSGGMGVVLDAFDTVLGRPVALKVLPPSVNASYRLAQQRFLREARAAAGLRDEHLVTIYEVAEISGVSVLAMERLHGMSLEDRLQSGSELSLAEIVELFTQLLQGLAHAHRQAIVHRDIKPSNIFIEQIMDATTDRPSPLCWPPSWGPEWCPTTRVKIVDFGLARPQQVDAQITCDEIVMGTPGYWSPEHVTGKVIGPESDLFSAGCVLYRLLTRRMAFTGSDVLEYLMAMATVRVPSPDLLQPQLPLPLARFTLRLLQREPHARWSNAGLALEAWHGVLQESRTALVSGILLDEPLADHGPSDTTVSSTPPHHLAPHRRPPTSTWRWFLLFALGCGIVSSGILLRWSTQHGTLVVEGTNDDVEIRIESDQLGRPPQLVVIERATRREITLVPGQYTVQVREKDGLEFSTAAPIVLRNGAREVLRAEYLLRRPPPDTTPSVTCVVERTLGDAYLRHWSWLTCLAIDETNQTYITGSYDGSVQVWDRSTRAPRVRLGHGGREVRAVAVDGKTQRVITAGVFGIVRIWRPSGDVSGEYQQEHALVHGDSVQSVQLSRDGTMLATLARNFARIYDVATGRLVRELHWDGAGIDQPNGCAWLASGQRLAVRAEHAVHIIDVATSQEVQRLDRGDDNVWSVESSPDEQYLAMGIAGAKPRVQVIQASDGRVVHEFVLPVSTDGPIALDFSKDQTWLLAVIGQPIGGDAGDSTRANRIVQWSLTDGTQRPPIRSPVFSTGFLAARYTGNNETILAGGRQHWAAEWNAVTGVCLEDICSNVWFTFAAYEANHIPTVAVGGLDGRIGKFPLAGDTNPTLIGQHDANVLALEYMAQRGLLVSAGADLTVRAWDVEQPHLIWTTGASASGVRLLPSHNQVVLGGRWYEHPMQIMSAEHGEPLVRADGAERFVSCFDVNDRQERIIEGFAHEPAVVRSLLDGKRLSTLTADPTDRFVAANTLEATPSGDRVVIAYGRDYADFGHVAVWDLPSGTLQGELPEYERRVMSLAISPDERWLATGGWYDATIRIWSLATRQMMALRHLEAIEGGIVKMQFLTSDQLLALGTDGRLYLLRITNATP